MASFSALPAQAITRAPMTLPISTAVSPTPPAAPVTSSHSPGCSRARDSSATCDVPYVTGNAAALGKSMLAGIGSTRGASTTTSSAYAPVPVSAITRSPGFNPRTLAPTSATVPAASMPGVNGNAGFSWYCPAISSRSAKLMPTACTAIRTAPSLIAGEGTSSITSFSGPPHSLHNTARIGSLLFLEADILIDGNCLLHVAQEGGGLLRVKIFMPQSILRQPTIHQPHGQLDRRHGLSIRRCRTLDLLPIFHFRFRRIQHHLPVVIALRIKCEIARTALRYPSLGQFHRDRNILCRVGMVMQLQRKQHSRAAF